jgi:hypothetical protein
MMTTTTTPIPAFNFGDVADALDPDLLAAVRPDVLKSISLYVHHGVDLGDFLTAVAENNLSEALGRADEYNRPTVFDIVRIFYNYCPSDCWGSRKKRIAWQTAGGLKGLRNDGSDRN